MRLHDSSRCNGPNDPLTISCLVNHSDGPWYVVKNIGRPFGVPRTALGPHCRTVRVIGLERADCTPLLFWTYIADSFRSNLS